MVRCVVSGRFRRTAVLPDDLEKATSHAQTLRTRVALLRGHVAKTEVGEEFLTLLELDLLKAADILDALTSTIPSHRSTTSSN